MCNNLKFNVFDILNLFLNLLLNTTIAENPNSRMHEILKKGQLLKQENHEEWLQTAPQKYIIFCQLELIFYEMFSHKLFSFCLFLEIYG